MQTKEELIYTNYFLPLIQVLEETGIQKQKYILQETIRLLQLRIRRPQSKNLNFIERLSEKHIPLEFKKYLIQYPRLLEQIKHLGRAYFTGKVEETTYCYGTIDSIFRECVFNYLNPLPAFKMASINSKTIAKKLTNIATLSDLPLDIWPTIYNFLDYKSRFSLGRTCKSSYFFHKKSMDLPKKVFYLLGGEVQITKKRGFFDSSVYINLVDHISENKILKSLIKQNYTLDAPNNFKAFASLFQALEYAYFQQHGGTIDDFYPEGFMPTIWAVLYADPLENLSYTQEFVEIYPNQSCSSYDLNSRRAAVKHTQLPLTSFIPLKGIALYPTSEIGSYKIFGSIDYIEHLQKQSEENDIICSIF